jgi:hypothetical protein
VVSKSSSFAQSGSTVTRTVRSYRARTPASQSAKPSAGTSFRFAARYASGSPSTSSTRAVPRISSTRGGHTPWVSIVIATLGFARSARTFADPGTVPITRCSPSHWNPIGTTRGSPLVPT